MSKPQTKKAEIQSGKLYVLRSEVWAIDATVDGFIQVYVREQIFKIKPDQLVYLEGVNNE
jgi:hypothetical protein